MSSEDEDMEYEYHPDTPEEVNKSDNTTATVLPPASKAKYDKVYDDFQKWNKLKGATPVSQNVLIKYFAELAKKKMPTTLWTYHSMLKATLRLNDNIDINSYSKLIDFLKTKSSGYKPRVVFFTEKDIEKFLNTAPDQKWLDVKVFCIFAVNGIKSSNKLVAVKLDNVKEYEDLILVTIPKTDTSPKRSFTITGMFFSIVKKYIALRPEQVTYNSFFLQYHEGKCKTQSIGRGSLCEMPRRIAKYLKLPKPECYTANSFRIISTNIGAKSDAFSAPSVAEKKRIEYSLDYETGHLKPSLISYTSPSVSATSNKNDNMNDNMNGINTGHVCTIICGQVKCAMEENEESVLHAFTIMKPSNYIVTEVTPAVFNSYPNCRWIVAYTHITEPVTSFNAYETFEHITKSIPNNVKVVQKYIRGNSSQLVPAYVVEYGVNCRCRKQSSDLFNCSVNEIKCASKSIREQVCSYIL